MANKVTKFENLYSLSEDLQHVFEFPNSINYIQEFFSDNLYIEIMNTFWFKRLFSIPFLGGLSYIDSNDKTNTRGHHSIGVALLAYYYSKINNLKKRDEQIWVLSGLLHDIHHLPFSHTMEYALKSKIPSFSLHDFDRKIVFEKNANEINESISDIVKRYNIDIENEAFFLKTKDRRPTLFNSTHNLDTLEGITRVYHKCLQSPQNQNYSLPKRIIEVISCHNKNDSEILSNNIETFDCFWMMKNDVYSQEIYDEKKVFFERILSYYLYYLCHKNSLLDKLYYLTDKDFFEKFPDLRLNIRLLWSYIKTSSNNFSRDIDLYSNKDPKIKLISQKSPLNLYIKTRQFKINSEKYLTFGEKHTLKKRYEINNRISTLKLDPNAILNIEKVVTHPINQYINKICVKGEDMVTI